MSYTADHLNLANNTFKISEYFWRVEDYEIKNNYSGELKKLLLSLNMIGRDYSYARGLNFIKKVIFNGPATIVFWKDGTKTVVKYAEGENYDKRVAIMWAAMKKMHGNSSRVNKILDNLIEDAEKISGVTVKKPDYDINKLIKLAEDAAIKFKKIRDN